MQIHRIRGRNLRDALQRARRTHGDEALVLSQETLPGGGIAVAVTHGERRARAREATREALDERAVRRSAHAPAAERAVEPAIEPGRRDVAERLARSGASRDLIEAVLGDVDASGARGAYAIDVAAESLGRRFAIAPSPRGGGTTRVLAVVGAPGSGKTSVVSRLAAHLVRARRRVRILSMDDPRRGGATLPLLLASLVDRPAGVKGAIESVRASRQADLVLADTSGAPFRDVPDLRALRKGLRAQDPALELDVYVVLAADESPEQIDASLTCFLPLAPKAAVLTRLDESRAPLAALEALAGRLPVSFLCTGQDASSGLHRASASLFADLGLRGKLP